MTLADVVVWSLGMVVVELVALSGVTVEEMVDGGVEEV